jgi:oxygen-dependent protoporphyrinogen oxidase
VSCRRVLIIGGGISALSLGWFLKKQFAHKIDVQILESKKSPGGQIRTSVQDGFLFEQGPHSFRTTRSNALSELIEGLALQSAVIEAAPAARNRYIYFKNKLRPLPKGILSLLYSRFSPIIFKALYRDIRAPKSNHGNGLEDESVRSFITRRFGNDAAEYLCGALISGIWAGDISALSANSVFPALKRKEHEKRSLLWSMLTSPRRNKDQAVYIGSFKQGMGALIDALAGSLQPHIRYDAAVDSFICHGDGVAVKLSSGEVLEGDLAVSAVPAHVLAGLIPHAPELRDLLLGIRTVPVAVVNVGYRRKVLAREGFGYLVPPSAKENILGVIWDSSAFPQQNHACIETRLTVMLGGAHFPEISTFSDEKLLKLALDAIQKHMGIDVAPDASAVTLMDKAIPQYNIGHENLLHQIEWQVRALSPRLRILGSSFYGISVGDCIEKAKTTMQEVEKYFLTKFPEEHM